MSDKKLFNDQDKSRLMSGEAKKNDGKVESDSLAAKAQKAVDKRNSGKK